MDLYPNLKKAYGPYLRKDGRKHMVLVFNNNSKRTVSYPKWLVENKIGRRLTDEETVDHFDRDFTNDNLDNLRVKTRSIHAKEDALRIKKVEIKCVWCGKKAFKRASDLDHNSSRGKGGPFCGHSCAGKYGKSVQMKENIILPDRPLKVNREYYKLDKT